MPETFSDHSFCRTLLKLTMEDVRKVFKADEIRKAWAWGDGRTGNQSFEFHGPNEEYLYNLRSADCKWSAAAEGWQQLLDARDRHNRPCEVAPTEKNGEHDWIDAGNGDDSQRCGWCGCSRGATTV